ncbi:MAG: hypothetical protein ACHREM_07040 [Polyangiales bacterium]
MFTALLFLAIGYLLYRREWPDGFLPPESPAERERVRRIGRRHVEPAALLNDDGGEA